MEGNTSVGKSGVVSPDAAKLVGMLTKASASGVGLDTLKFFTDLSVFVSLFVLLMYERRYQPEPGAAGIFYPDHPAALYPAVF